MSRRNSFISGRVIFIFAIGVLVWFALIARLWHIQISNGYKYKKMAVEQQQTEMKLPTERGLIYDRNIQPLAINLPSTSFYVNPNKLENPQALAKIFSSYLKDESYNDIYKRIAGAQGSFAWLSRQVPDEIAQKIEELNLENVYSILELKRYYPQKENGSSLIGFTGVDNQGLSGIETKFDDILCGEPGQAIFERYARGGGRFYFDDDCYIRPKKGSSLVLTINSSYQEIVQQELRRAYLDYQAKSCSMIIMDPKTGEILAMANEPTFDPNSGNKTEHYLYKNRTISDVFEPGSTFKVIAVAAALEEHSWSTEDVIYCEDGKLAVANWVFHDYRPYKDLTFRQVIEKSSNIGTIKIAEKLGKNKLYEYIRAFGFGTKARINLPAESDGIFRTPDKWSLVSLSSIAIGQEISVTSLQLANSFCAIANKGTLMQPYIIKEIVNEKGRVQERNHPQKIRQVVSQTTADTLTSILIGVVENGTGVKAQIPGITVAGKTGTAQKSDPIHGGYASGKYIASFAGFLPAEAPQFVGLVVIEEPEGELYYGGDVAAPVFKRVMEKIICLESSASVQIAESVMSSSGTGIVRVPDVRGLNIDEASAILRQVGLVPEIESGGSVVIAQQHYPNTLTEVGSTVTLNLQDIPADINTIGMSLRRAYERLSNLGFEVKIQGQGVVVSQIPLANGKGYKIICK